MNKEELRMLITITLEKEFDDLKRRINTFQIEEVDKKRIVKYEHSDTLIDIFSNIQSTKELKEEFISILESEIKKSVDMEIRKRDERAKYASSASLCFYTLIKLGYVINALNALEQRATQTISGHIFTLLLYIFSEDYTYFDLAEITRLLEIIKKQQTGGRYYAEIDQDEALSILRTSAYEIAKKSIKGINIEINRDKKQVETLVKYLEFDVKYNKLLNEIDKFINTDSGVLSSGMISNLRSFMEDLLTDLAKKIASFCGEEIPKYEGLGEMGCIRKYLKIKLELSENDNSFINRFIDVLHSEGGHSFVSNKDYFRLARNIAIEIVLLILSKYQAKYAK